MFLSKPVSTSASASASASLLLTSTTAAVFGAVTALCLSKFYFQEIKTKKNPRRRASSTSCSADSDITSDVGNSSSYQDFNSVVVTLPPWAVEESSNLFHKSYDTDGEKMALAIYLSARNINERTGGPFGTAIFYKNTLVAIGMNRVVPLSNSTLHGEVVAIQMAQKKCQTFSLQNVEVLHDDNQMEDEKKEDGGAVYELFTSCEPCAMCLGATLWSGVGRLVCAATKDDAMKIGFDEGPVFEQSYKYLEDRGIEVVRNVMRDEAAAVLKRYGEIGVIYNR